MGVRVRVGVRLGDKDVEAVALVNSGYETESPQLLVPYAFLVRNNISLAELGRPVTMEYDTAGGPISLQVYPGACRVTVLEEDRRSKSVHADLAVSPIEREILMSDALTEELGIIILSPKSGLWRFTDDPPDKTRQSHPPQYY